MELKKNSLLTLTIDGYNSEGLGVARQDGGLCLSRARCGERPARSGS
jgi:hypothetical protein